MFWRLPPAEYEAAFRERSLQNVRGGPATVAMAKLVAGGTVPGLLAYRAGEPVGWVSVSPRSQLARLAHTTQLSSDEAPADEQTWSISCFYVHRSHARSSVGKTLLAAAAVHAVAHGATAVEGYPVKAGSVDPYTGYDTMFAAAGFRLVQPGRGKGRALWRRDLRR